MEGNFLPMLEFRDSILFLRLLPTGKFALHLCFCYHLSVKQTYASHEIQEVYMSQQFLFKPLIISKDQLKKFQILFSNLPAIEILHPRGRHSLNPKFSFLCATIYKNLRGLSTFSDILNEIKDIPDVKNLLGFNYLPNKERFSSFIRDTPNEFFQSIRETIVHELVSLGEITGKYLSCDNCPIFAHVKENNFTTNVPNRYDKTKIPDGDPDATLSAYVVYQPEKKLEYFWGYRNHIINDALKELPVAEITKPNNVSGSVLFIPQFKYVKDTFNFNIKVVIGDSEFDSAQNIEFIVKELNAKPVIARNPRSGSKHQITFSDTGHPICIAGIPMLSRGVYFDKEENRWRHKFICRIKGSKKFAKQIGWCPLNHPNFVNNRYGCCINKRVDVDDSFRKSIDYGSETFKKLYALRTSSERIFSRLLNCFMQYPTVTGLQAVSNISTIAHITVLLIALTAVKTGHKDKIRFIKNFIRIL